MSLFLPALNKEDANKRDTHYRWVTPTAGLFIYKAGVGAGGESEAAWLAFLPQRGGRGKGAPNEGASRDHLALLLNDRHIHWD